MKSPFKNLNIRHKCLDNPLKKFGNEFGSILDIGCRYTNKNYKQLLGANNYIGLDIDVTIILEKRKLNKDIYHLLDFSKN